MKTTLRLIIAAFVLATFNLSAATLYVWQSSPNPSPPFTNWATAATNIQDAVDVAKDGDTVLVTNGVYATGERDVSVADTNLQPPQMRSAGASRVVVTNSIRLESVNGPLVTTIAGSPILDQYGWPTNSLRCVFLGTNAVLSGFTLTNGGVHYYTRDPSGGGVFSVSTNVVVTNCVITGNSAGCGGGAYFCTLYNCTLTGNWGDWGGGACFCVLNNCTLSENSSLRGGGACFCVLNNCTLSHNSATEGDMGFMHHGGGASDSTLYNCTLVGNSAALGGGGASGSILFNCIVYYNDAPNGANYLTGTNDWGMQASSQLHYCCTTPLPTNGIGNITGPPLFMDMAADDMRLWEGSPCIDAGMNLVGFSATVTNTWGDAVVLAYNYEPTDILGNTRFVDGDGDGIVAWDLGAYEFNSFKPPRFIGSPQRTAEGWTLNVTGEPNKWTRIQRSGNLKDWNYFWSGSMPPDGMKQVTDYETNQMMFYRALVP